MIAGFLEKSKPFLTPLIIVLVGIAAFGLGRLSVMQENKAGLVIYTNEEAN